MPPAPLTLHARVRVARLGAGEVLFVGQTSFAQGLWIGIQLDEPAGKNDGSVQGKRYFHAAPGFGVFVRPSQVDVVHDDGPLTPPTPPTSHAHHAPHAPRTEPRHSIRTPQRSMPSASPLRRSAHDSAAVRSSVNRIRRTQALAAHASPSHSLEAAQTPPRRPPTGSSPGNVSGRPSRAPGAYGARGARTPRATGAQATHTPDVRMPTPSGVRSIPRPTLGTPHAALRAGAAATAAAGSERGPQQASSPLRSSPLQRVSSPERVSSPLGAPPDEAGLTAAPSAESSAAALACTQDALRATQAQLADAEARARAASEAAHAAEQARASAQLSDADAAELQAARAAVARLTEAHDTHEARLEELTEALELATLDREMAEEKAEQLEHELQATRERAEELQLEWQLHKEEPTDAPHASLAPEQAQLWEQNARLKEALVRLRDATRETERARQEELRSLRAESEATQELQTAHDATKHELARAHALIDELRAQSELAQSAEEMLEQLTERNGALERRCEELDAQVHELDTLRAVSDELEEAHLESEAQLQHEIALRDELNARLRTDAAAHAAQLADYDATVRQFRELVREQTRELETLRGRVTDKTPPPAAAAGRAPSTAPPLLPAALRKSHLHAIRPALEQLATQHAQRHLDLVRVYLPPAFWAADEAAIGTLLVLEQIAKLSTLLRHTLEAGADVQDAYLAGTLDVRLLGSCTLRHALAHLAALAEHVAAALGTAPPDVFVAHARHAQALAPVEQQLRAQLEALQEDRMDEEACRALCHAVVPQLEHVSVGLQTHASLADLAAKEAGSVTLAAHDVDTLLAGAGLACALLPNEDAPYNLDEARDALHALVGAARRARVPARNMVRLIQALRRADEAVVIESVPQLPQLGQRSSALAARAANMAHALHAYAHATQVDPSAPHAATLRAALAPDLATMVHEANDLVHTLDALHTAMADPANATPRTYVHTDPVADTPPWPARAALLHAAMQHDAAAEARAAALAAEIDTLQRTLRARADALDAATVKNERLAFQLEKARTLATSASDLRAQVEALEAQRAAAVAPTAETWTEAEAATASHAPDGDVHRALRVVRRENQHLRAAAHLETVAALPALATPHTTRGAGALPWDALAAEARALAAAPRLVDVCAPMRRGAAQYAAQCRARCRLAEQVARIV